MSKNLLCQGIHCPNRSECLHNARYLAAPIAERRSGKTIAHCIDQKDFERKALDHPQMRGSYPRGC